MPPPTEIVQTIANQIIYRNSMLDVNVIDFVVNKYITDICTRKIS